MRGMLVLVGIMLFAMLIVAMGSPDLDAQARVRAGLEQEVKVAHEQRDVAVREVVTLKTVLVDRDAQIAAWQAKYASLDEHVRYLDSVLVERERQLAQVGIIPVTNAAPAEMCLITYPQVEQFGATVGILMMGVVVLGGGGWIAYRTSPNRKITVRMTHSQYEEYARYLEGGNRAG